MSMSSVSGAEKKQQHGASISSDNNNDSHMAHLFVKDSSPMVFHLPPGSTKKKTAPIIKQFGGQITSIRLRNSICLADEKLWTSGGLLRDSDCYWPSYIMDCVKERTLLDIEQYRCSKGTRLMRRLPPVNDNDPGEKNGSGEDEMWDIDDGMAPAKTVVRVQAPTKGRMKYTKAEDMKIIKYLLNNQVYDRAKGTAVWNRMAKLQITSHSAQSMMTRYRDIISKQLNQYNIPDSWKCRLTGDLSYVSAARTQHDGDDENETELDKQISLVLLHNSGDKEDHASGNQLTEVRTDVEDNSGVVIESSDDEDDFDKNLLGMISSTPADRQVKNVTQTAKKSPSPNSCGSQPHLTKHLAVPLHAITVQGKSAQVGTSPAKKRRVDVEEGACDTQSHVSGSTNDGESGQDLLDVHLMRKEPGSQKGKEDSESNKGKEYKAHHQHKCAPLSNSEENSPSSMSASAEGATEVPAPWIRSKKHHTQDLAKESPQKAEEGCRKSPRKSKSALTNVSPSKQWTRGSLSPRQKKSSPTKEVQQQKNSQMKKASGTAAKTQFMESALGLVGIAGCSQQNDCARLADTSISERVQNHLHSRAEERRVSSLPKNHPKGKTSSRAASGPAVRVNLKSQTATREMNTSVDGSDAEEPEEEKDRVKRPKRMTAHDVVKVLSAKFGLTLPQTRTLLIRHSGHTEATCYWIMTGRCLPGHHYWTPSEDKVVLQHFPDHKDWQKLEEKYGLPAVLKRIHWLQAKD